MRRVVILSLLLVLFGYELAAHGGDPCHMFHDCDKIYPSGGPH